MGKSTSTSSKAASSAATAANESSGPAKKRVTLRRKAAKKASFSTSAPASVAHTTGHIGERAAEAASTATATTAASMSREDRKKLIAAARAQGMLPPSTSIRSGSGEEKMTIKYAKVAQAKNPNSRRRPRGTRRHAIVPNGDEESGQSGLASAFLTPAEERMAQVHEELEHFDATLLEPGFLNDPFAAVARHLTETMTTLKPLTPDVGRLPE